VWTWPNVTSAESEQMELEEALWGLHAPCIVLCGFLTSKVKWDLLIVNCIYSLALTGGQSHRFNSVSNYCAC